MMTRCYETTNHLRGLGPRYVHLLSFGILERNTESLNAVSETIEVVHACNWY